MKTFNRRVENLESGLTPKQAILLFLQEARAFHGIKEYFLHLQDQPENSWPIDRLTCQVAEGVKQTLKGRPREEIDRAVHQAYKDVLFLYHLHERVNEKIISEERHDLMQCIQLTTELRSLLREQAFDRRSKRNRSLVEIRMPYPLGLEAVAAITAAQNNHVITWEILEESDDLGEWLRMSFVAKGKTLLPDGAEEISSGLPTRDEIRALFQNARSYRKFLDGDDYSYGLADVANSEFEALYEATLKEIKTVVQEGAVVELSTVPHQFLRDAPLLAGEWIDRYTVELAEWGAQVQKNGFNLDDVDDINPLAWSRIVDSDDMTEVDTTITKKLWEQARKRLARFQGRTIEIEGRPYLSFADYSKWRGRVYKGDVKPEVSSGIDINLWNKWVEDHGGEGAATLATVKVGKLRCYVEGYHAQICQDADELDREMGRRKLLLESMQARSSYGTHVAEFHLGIEHWMEKAVGFLSEHYTLRSAIRLIDKRYFEGQKSLFPSAAEGLDQLLSAVEEMVVDCDRDLASNIGDAGRNLDILPEGQNGSRTKTILAELREAAEGSANRQITFFVDLAKADALCRLGQTRQALEIVYRHV